MIQRASIGEQRKFFDGQIAAYELALKMKAFNATKLGNLLSIAKAMREHIEEPKP